MTLPTKLGTAFAMNTDHNCNCRVQEQVARRLHFLRITRSRQIFERRDDDEDDRKNDQEVEEPVRDTQSVWPTPVRVVTPVTVGAPPPGGVPTAPCANATTGATNATTGIPKFKRKTCFNFFMVSFGIFDLFQLSISDNRVSLTASRHALVEYVAYQVRETFCEQRTTTATAA